MFAKLLNSIILTVCVFCSCSAQKAKWKHHPNLTLKIMHGWEQLIYETSIESSSVNLDTKEVYSTILSASKNTFILHYKIATVESQITSFENSGGTKNEFKDYKLSYNKDGYLIEVDEGITCVSYYYNEKGVVDSTAMRISVMGGEVGKISFSTAKDIKTWDRVKGKTEWTRLVERELYSAFYQKRKKAQYELAAKLKYVYFRDGLLKEIKSFDAEGKLKRQEKFKYTFY